MNHFPAFAFGLALQLLLPYGHTVTAWCSGYALAWIVGSAQAQRVLNMTVPQLLSKKDSK